MSLKEEIVQWIKEKVKEARAKGIVVGLSGGIDSSVVASLSREAIKEKVLGVIMPCQSSADDEHYALMVAERLQIKTEKVVLDSVYKEILKIFPPGNQLSKANLKPRLRMIVSYYFANNLNYLVAGTGNKSEITVGYFTKYGDGGADILPLGGLLKSEVRKLAKELNIPREIIERPPTAGLWKGQTDEGELGISYEELDRIIQGIELNNTKSLPLEKVTRVKELIKASQHKRLLAPVFEKQI